MSRARDPELVEFVKAVIGEVQAVERVQMLRLHRGSRAVTPAALADEPAKEPQP